VSAPVAGRLVKVAIDLGAQVKAGTMLAVLESAELAEARTAYQQSQTELDLAKLTFERAQKLSVDRSIAPQTGL
jgi:cobalt-zinc-cadmium efflux system membrane fusion protein